MGYVLGASGSGKTSLLRSFVGKGFGEFDEREGEEGGGRVGLGKQSARGEGKGKKGMDMRGKGKSVVNCVEEGGGERYLVVSFQTSFSGDDRSS